MLIGIDMIGLQSPGAGSSESGRLARQLLSGLLARESADRYVLYIHEGLSTDRVPTGRNALRVTLPGGQDGASKVRASIQRVLDQNPDGLDWLVLLDPFDPSYGGMPPDSPLNGVKVASLVTDLSPSRVDDRRLAPLRNHEAILAISGATAEECRLRLPSSSRRIEPLGLAVDGSWTDVDSPGPLTSATGAELARLGIEGPFLFASLASGAERSNLAAILEAYQRLPLHLQKRHQLVVAGELDDPWAALAYLHSQGCAEGLVLAGPVEESTLRTLYQRCSAFISPGLRDASTLSLLEAMSCGSPIIAGRAGTQPDVLGDAGLLANPSDPGEIAGQVERVLSDVDLQLELRRRAKGRSRHFPWEPVVEGFMAALQGRESGSPTGSLRFDRAHVARPRVAVHATGPLPGHFNDRVARACLVAHDVDLYFDPGEAVDLEQLAVELGGFDARQFDRNDAILDYRGVIYLLTDVFSLKANQGRLRARPGLVFLRDEASLDRIGLERFATGPETTDVEAEVACQRLRELFPTGSRLVVRSSRNLDAIRAQFPAYADRVFEMPPSGDGASADRQALSRRRPGPGEAPRGCRLLADLIEACFAEMAGGHGRPRRQPSGRMLGSPKGPHSPRMTRDSDDSYLEAR